LFVREKFYNFAAEIEKRQKMTVSKNLLNSFIIIRLRDVAGSDEACSV